MPQTQISQTSFQPPTEGLGDSPFIRFWYIGQNFIAGDGVTPVIVGDGQTGFYVDHVCSIVGDRVVMPAINLWATTDGSPGTSRFIGQLYTESGSPTSYFPFGQNGGWQLPTVYGAVIAYDQLMRYNAAAYLLSAPPSYFTADQTIAEIQRLAGDFAYANVGVLGITELDTAPDDPAHPIAVGINSPLLAQGFYFLSSYDSLADAVTDIGSDQATLLIAEIAAVSANLTIPANITLFFTNEGGIQPANTRTVTILGPVQAPPIKIFYNATAGQGTISFGTTSATNATSTCAQKEYWFEWWGAVGDNDYAKGTTNAAAIDAAFIALPNWATIRFNGRFYPINSGVTCHNKFQITVLGNDSATGYADNNTKPILVYRGSNGGTALTLANVYACTFKGFGVYGNDGVDLALGADIGIYLTFTQGSGFPGLTSHCQLLALNVSSINTRDGWVAIKVGDSHGNNNEHHTISDCLITGGGDYTTANKGIGIWLSHPQVKAVRLIRNNISAVGKAIRVSGSFRGLDNTMNNIHTAYYFDYLIDACYAQGDDTETLTKWIYTDFHDGAMSFKDCRIDVIQATGDSLSDVVMELKGPFTFYDCTWLNNNRFSSGQNFGPYFMKSDGGRTMFVDCLWQGGNNQNPRELAAGFNTGSTVVTQGGNVLYSGSGAGGLGDDQMMSANGAYRRSVFASGANVIGSAPFPDGLNLGDGSVGIGGLCMPGRMKITVVGTPGSTDRRFTLIAIDAAGRRSLAFSDASGGSVQIATSNATLSAGNRLEFYWPAQYPAPDHYELWDVDPGNSANGRYVDDIIPSGTVLETYSLTSNPAGAYGAFRPTWNEAGFINLRNTVVSPNEVTFTANDTSPSVAIANDFATANAIATTITAFDDPTTGQQIRIRIGDANTTFQNSGSLVTGTGANLAAEPGAVYNFIYRNSAWRRIL